MSKQNNLNFKQIVLVLLSVGVLSSLMLGLGHHLTKESIIQAQKDKEYEALKDVVVEDFDNDPIKEVSSRSVGKRKPKVEIYPVRNKGRITSMVVKSYSDKGFSGRIEVMVGFHPHGKIHKVNILKQTETPGLGSKITENKFLSQFEEYDPGYHVMKVTKDGGDVDAVTGATISSRAVLDALEKAYEVYLKFKMDN